MVAYRAKHCLMKAAPLYTTRPAARSDFEFLYRLHVSTMREYVSATWGWDDALQERMFRDRFDPSHIEVIEHQATPVGMWSVDESGDAVSVLNIQIEPAYQRLGIATAMLRTLVARASGTGRAVSLSVLKVNPARGLYERLGFAVVAETSTHFLMRTRAGK